MIHWHFKKEKTWPPLAERGWIDRRIDLLEAQQYYGQYGITMITEKHVVVPSYKEWLEQLENGHKR